MMPMGGSNNAKIWSTLSMGLNVLGGNVSQQ